MRKSLAVPFPSGVRSFFKRDRKQKTAPRDVLVILKAARKERIRRITRRKSELSTRAIEAVFQQVKSEYDSFKPGPKNDQETLATIFFGIKDEELVAVYVYSTGKYSTVLYMPYGVEPAEIMSALERMYVLVEALSLTWVR